MFSLNFQNSFGNGSFYPDAGFKFTDRLNMVNEANFIFSSSSSFRRSQLDIGTIVSISEKDASGTTSYEFYGFIDDIQTVEGGGMNVHAIGQEGWLGKQNGVYSSSPWTSVDAVTIFNAIIAESSKISSASSDDFGNTSLTEYSSDSLWNALMNLSKITGQDVDVEYTGSGGVAFAATIALKNNRHSGSFVSKDTLNSGKEIEDISVGRSFPIANSITVFGKGEGTTRIKSDTGHGQDLASQATWGVIYQPVTNYTIASVTAANQLADAEVAKLSAIVKTYQFTMKVKRYRTNFIAGDLLTLNSQEQSLTNEVVRITQIEKGMQNGAEYMIVTVADQAYSRLTKNVDMVIAQNQKVAQQSSTFDQYQNEYSNQNVNTCVGGIMSTVGGMSQYVAFNTGTTVCIPYLQVGDLSPGCSSTNTLHNTNLDMCGHNILHANIVCASCFCGAGGGGTNYWNLGIGYIYPCNSCAVCLSNALHVDQGNIYSESIVGGNYFDCTSTHVLGCASSPGAFKEVNAACGIFTSLAEGAVVCGTSSVCSPLIRGSCICGTTSVNGGIIGGTTGMFSGCLSAACVGINGSSTCALYVSGNGVITGNFCSSEGNICAPSGIGCFSNVCSGTGYFTNYVRSPCVCNSGDVYICGGSGNAAVIAMGNTGGIRPSVCCSTTVLGTSAYRWGCAYLICGVSCSSDRNKKTCFCEPKYSDILGKYRTIQVNNWSWKDNIETKNIGMTAQDFNNSFKDYMNFEDETSISSSNHAGIQDAAIKGLIECVDCMKEEISCLKQYQCK